jgi:hypothetical protein
MRFNKIFEEIVAERNRAEQKHGKQFLPLGCSKARTYKADYARDLCESARKRNRLTWRHVLTEEIEESFAEDDKSKIREELVQCAAIIFKMIEAIDNGEVINE